MDPNIVRGEKEGGRQRERARVHQCVYAPLHLTPLHYAECDVHKQRPAGGEVPSQPHTRVSGNGLVRLVCVGVYAE